jgi:SAM-dependent methyltransferase
VFSRQSGEAKGAAMQRPSWAPSDIDIDRPSISRVWDWFLGGAHNFAADREAGRKTLEVMPEGPLMAKASRAFLARAVRWCAEAGITQFLDIGSGIPTAGNVHEIVQQVNRDARVAYVDIDPVAVTHTQLLIGDDERVAVVYGDALEPERILSAPELRHTLDLDRPVALVMVALLHFVSDAQDPRGILARFRSALAPGSHLVIAHGTAEIDGMPPAHIQAAMDSYQNAVAPVTLRSRAEVAALFDGFDLVDPGVVWLQDWRPDPAGVLAGPQRPKASFGGVGRLP